MDARLIHRLTDADCRVDAVTMAKALWGAWLCRRLDDGTIMRRRIIEMEAYCGEEDTAGHAHKNFTAAPRIGFAYATPRDDQRRKWRFTVMLRGSSLRQYPS